MIKLTTGEGHKPAPLTSQQKQSRRRAALDSIARANGWASWDAYATAVKRGLVQIDTAHAPKRAAKETKE